MSKKKKNSLLWKITGDDLPAPSYLFGTMHVRDERAFGLTEALQGYLNECRAFATEFNLRDAAVGIDADALNLPSGKTLSDYLSPHQYAKLRRTFLKYFGFDIAAVRTSLPLVITNTLSAMTLHADREVSLDEYLWQFAEAREKITLGIETYAEQLAVLQKIPLDYQLKTLRDAARHISGFRHRHQKMTALYARQDIHELYKSARKNLGKIRKLLLYNRNYVMAERIVPLIGEQSLFCAVGAAHLAGKHGLIKLLKDNNLTVKPVHISSVYL